MLVTRFCAHFLSASPKLQVRFKWLRWRWWCVCVCGQWPFFLSLDRDLHATELTISRKLTALLLLIASGGHNFCTIIHRTHTKVLACCHCYANTLTDFRATKSRWICVKRILHANRVCCVLFWHLLSKRNVFLWIVEPVREEKSILNASRRFCSVEKDYKIIECVQINILTMETA